MRRPRGVVTFVTTIALLVGACSAAPVGNQRRPGPTQVAGEVPVNDAAGMNAEYQAELRRLEFPAGFHPASHPPGYEDDANFETGLGTDSAEFQWLCAWFGEVVDQQAKHPDRAGHGLDVLATFPKMQLWTHMDPAGRQTIMDAVTAAKASDLSGIRSQREAMMCAR
jgi:hypothetical protein